jgi:hypothetical protein
MPKGFEGPYPSEQEEKAAEEIMTNEQSEDSFHREFNLTAAYKPVSQFTEGMGQPRALFEGGVEKIIYKPTEHVIKIDGREIKDPRIAIAELNDSLRRFRTSAQEYIDRIEEIKYRIETVNNGEL